jgi:hypothetical protein
MNQLVTFTSRAPALASAAGERASYRFFEFFTAQVRNPNTRRAYARELACPRHVKNRSVHWIIRFTRAVQGGNNIGTALNISSRTARSCEKARKP